MLPLKRYFLAAGSAAFLFTSCGYQLGTGSLSNNYQTISIPYAAGDTTGQLTASLVKEVAKSGAFRYLRWGGELTLNVAVVDFYEDNVGFQYNYDRQGKREHYIIPNETRVTLVADVTVTESASGCRKLGPVRISASVVFDHQYYFGTSNDNKISLGQLTDIDSARDSVIIPLNRALAEKIIDYVIYSW